MRMSFSKVLRNYDDRGVPLDTYRFEKVKLKKGQRTYIWRYSSK